MGLGLMFSLTNIKAQTADFENLTLTPESFWDGSDLSGTHNNGEFYSEFTSSNCTLPNVFDTTWGAPGYWLGGFAYSNITDTTTSGAGNKYSAKAGSGYNGSNNYVIAQNNSSINTNGAQQIINFKISNSTYTYNSMRDGDAFAKKFGGPSGNDPDWFKVTIKAFFQGNFKDSTDFYLADFRFTDNSQDYIVNDWRTTSVITMSTFDSVYFELNSSDVGAWGMNTPSFFCMDYVELALIVNINEITQNNFSLYPNPASIVLTIRSEEVIEAIKVLDINGRTIKNNSTINAQQHQLNVADLKAGVYFIQLISNGTTQIQKFVKQ